MKKNNFFFLIIFIIFFNLTSSPVYSFKNTNSSNDLNSDKVIIIALDVTRKKSQQNLINLNQNTSLSKEINETTVFINYLSYQIKNYCSQIYNKYGSNALTDMPCHLMAEKIDAQTSAIYEEKEIETADEQIANLDNEFMNSLGDFDEMLLIEDEIIASQSRKSDSSSMNGGQSNSGSDSSSNKNTNNSNSGKSAQTSQQKKDQNSTEETQNKTTVSSSSAKGNQGRSSKEQSKRRRKLDEIDDDIVARQLKEAAEKETDAELKKRLWDEYYKYKQNTIQ